MVAAFAARHQFLILVKEAEWECVLKKKVSKSKAQGRNADPSGLSQFIALSWSDVPWRDQVR